MVKTTETANPGPVAPARVEVPAASSAGHGFVEIPVRGKKVKVPSMTVQGRTVAINGKWLKIASVFDEEAIDGEVIRDPESFLGDLARTKCGADIFTFSQRIPETQPKYSYPFEWDNSAAVPITTYDEWFGKRIGTDVKQNIKKSVKRGVVVRSAPFDDQFVQGIVDIYNESPIRQGRPFWHYGKDFATIKAESAHCLEKSEFIGAYCGDEMIGFIKLLRVGVTNDLVLIVSKQSHFDKKPTNALLAKAVEVCAQKGVPYLTYAKFAYGNKATSSLAEFKRRHGFEQINFPRYYVPLTMKGRVAVKFKLYRSLKELLPEKTLTFLVGLRAKLYRGAGASAKSKGTGKETREKESQTPACP
jgi:hypothetical protein